jgi:uncharacterized protein YecT (DUF1311 family)
MKLQNCLDSSENYTTKGMTDGLVRATEKWEEELNKSWQELLPLLTTEQKGKLKIAQRRWLEYRNKEIEFSNQIYSDMRGTMWTPVAAQTKLELTKQRVIEIEAYMANLTMAK